MLVTMITRIANSKLSAAPGEVIDVPAEIGEELVVNGCAESDGFVQYTTPISYESMTTEQLREIANEAGISLAVKKRETLIRKLNEL